MRSRLAIPLVAAVAAVAPAPAAADATTLAAPPATVKLLDCSRDTHSASFHGRMKRIEGSERMWIRFTLLEKRAGGYRAVRAPGLGRWQRSKPEVGAFGYRQTVRGLNEGASYRMRVSYRWYDADRELLARARRRSRVCRQFVALPNLTAAIVGVRSTKVAGVLRYGVRVENTGAASASGVAVRLTVDGAVLNTVTVAMLRSGERRELGFRGPACGTSVSVAADPDGVLAESSESDNGQLLACADLPRT